MTWPANSIPRIPIESEHDPVVMFSGFGKMVAGIVTTTLVALFAFTLGMTADKIMEVPQLALVLKACQYAAHGLHSNPPSRITGEGGGN